MDILLYSSTLRVCENCMPFLWISSCIPGHLRVCENCMPFLWISSCIPVHYECVRTVCHSTKWRWRRGKQRKTARVISSSPVCCLCSGYCSTSHTITVSRRITAQKNPTIHQVTTMQVSSKKKVLFPSHNHPLTTVANDPTL